MSNKKLLQGVGINDAGYIIQKCVTLREVSASGRKKQIIVWTCPYYLKWKDMITRSYSTRYSKKQPTYIDCSVCEEWLSFSNFRKWMITQDWEGKHLDKDYLFQGNKEYSPLTCVFISRVLNNFITARGNKRGDYMIGCSKIKTNSKFQASCNNPFKKYGDPRNIFIGYFATEVEAHLAWKKRKHEYAVELATTECIIDNRVRQVLLTKYQNYTIVEDHIK